jgi:hypothetical protein
MLDQAALDALLGPPRRLPPDAWVTMPWRNGGGITHELLKVGEGAQGFGLRVSVAEITASGPFSPFDGVDRAIVLLSGAGVSLGFGPSNVVHLTAATPLYAFPGELAPTGELLSGPTTDLNVMTDRATIVSEVKLLGPGWALGDLLFLLQDGVVEGEPVAARTLLVRPGQVRCDAPTVAISVRARDRRGSTAADP